MASINGVDFNEVAKDALNAAKGIANEDGAWKELQDILKNITAGLKADIRLIAKRKIAGGFNEEDARIFLEDQKMIARIRLRSSAIVGIALAEKIWNAVADVFRVATKKALGWTVL